MNFEKTTNNKNIVEVVLGPVIFLDLFDYPVTAYEVWRYLDKKAVLTQIIYTLDELVRKNILNKKNGFYYLFGRDSIIDIRQRRYNYSCAKIKKARLFIKLFSFLPFIKLIAVANSIGAHNLRKGSDIDFFIITAANRIWLSRFISAGIAKVLRLRPTVQNKKDKICLSFYITESALNLKNLELPSGDPYFYFWLRDLRPIYNKKNTWVNFLQANSLLLGSNANRLENFEQDHSLSMNVKSTGYQLGKILEKIVKKIQLKIMAKSLRLSINNSDGVVVSDDILKLYLVDNRRQLASKFNLKINETFAKIN